MPDCIFCKIAAGEILSPKVYENDNVFVIDDINPVAKAHALVITKKHYPDILSIGIDETETLRAIQEAVLETARIKGIGATGFRLINNCGCDGGQTVPHLHFHIVGGEKLNARIIV